MKKGLIIFLLALFLLNVMGYYGIFLGLEFKNEKEMKSLFDDENSILQQAEITIKVPVTVPYATNSTEFTRVDGEFEHEGEVFRLVKQRVIRDTLYIVCVKDEQSKDIKQALTQYVKSFTDKPVSEKGSSKTIQSFIKDYISSVVSLQSIVIGWNNSLTYGEKLLVFESLVTQLNSPPPKA